MPKTEQERRREYDLKSLDKRLEHLQMYSGDDYFPENCIDFGYEIYKMDKTWSQFFTGGYTSNFLDVVKKAKTYHDAWKTGGSKDVDGQNLIKEIDKIIAIEKKKVPAEEKAYPNVTYRMAMEKAYYLEWLKKCIKASMEFPLK